MPDNITDLAAARTARVASQAARRAVLVHPDADLTPLVEQLGVLLGQVATNLAALEKTVARQDLQIAALTDGLRILSSILMEPTDAT